MIPIRLRQLNVGRNDEAIDHLHQQKNYDDKDVNRRLQPSQNTPRHAHKHTLKVHP